MPGYFPERPFFLMNTKVTIKDIAAACGVSTATVSYVLNNSTKQSISEATRKKVLHYANMVGYAPIPLRRLSPSAIREISGSIALIPKTASISSRLSALWQRRRRSMGAGSQFSPKAAHIETIRMLMLSLRSTFQPMNFHASAIIPLFP